MSPWKGKARADNDDYGNGGPDGIVLPLDMWIVSTYEAVYTIPIEVGTPPQTLSVQVDTGSSDLWLASSSCSTQACKQTDGRQYDDSKAEQTGADFHIQYVEGSVYGPIVWDTVRLGGYEIDGQALGTSVAGFRTGHFNNHSLRSCRDNRRRRASIASLHWCNGTRFARELHHRTERLRYYYEYPRWCHPALQPVHYGASIHLAFVPLYFHDAFTTRRRQLVRTIAPRHRSTSANRHHPRPEQSTVLKLVLASYGPAK